MARKSKAAILDEVFREGLKRFDIIQNRERENRALATEDNLFVDDHDGQWEQSILDKRKDRPCLTIDRVSPVIDQITGDQRQNRTQIKVRPADGDGSKDTALIFEGLTRDIEDRSNSENIYDGAFEEAVKGGYGGWRVITDYADDESFNQEIRLSPIRDAANSLFFGLSQEYDKRDATHAFYTTFMSLEDFKLEFPNASVSDFQQDNYSSNIDWFRTDEIRIAEYWRKVPIIRRIGLMSDGRILDLDDEKDALNELAEMGIIVERERKVKSHRVEMYVMNGAEILKGPFKWAGKYIPLIPCNGHVSYVNGREIVRGIVRKAKDPSRAYNYATSANIEAVALSPKDPFWVTARMIGDNKSQFENYNNNNNPFMIFEPDERVAGGMPQRTGAPSVQQGLIAITQQAAFDVETTTGMYGASLGNAPQLLSEKSIQSQAEKGDRGTFLYSDNLQKSIKYTGEILVDLLPKIYDTERTVRTLGLDGTTEVLKINEQAFNEFNETVIDEQTGLPVIVNDISKGRYDVEVTSGPAFSTKKKESLEQLISLSSASEEFAAVTGDLIAKSLDVIESEEIYKRMRGLYVKQGKVEPTEEEIEEFGLNQPQQPSPEQQALIENLNSQSQENLVSTRKMISEMAQKAVDGMETMVDTYTKQQEAGTPVSIEQQQALLQQVQLVMMFQQAQVA